MRQDTSKYQYEQLEIYKESLELMHLKRKTLVVNILVFLFSIAVLYFFIRLEKTSFEIISNMMLFVAVLFMNLAFYSFTEDLYNNLKISMYTTTIGVYVISISLIFQFQTPSIFTSIFLAYAITSIYQDYKAMILSNAALFVFGAMLVLRFPNIFEVASTQNSQILIILAFLMIFVLLLTISSYILIKRKTFFYNQLAKIKESEVRNMDLLMEIKEENTKEPFEYDLYYKSLDKFSKALSKKIGMDNVFSRKVSILKDMKKMSQPELLKKYPDYSNEELNEMRMMELAINNKMRKIGLKASKSMGIEVSRKEIFSESQFMSFRHYGDNMYIKIIAFAVFYVLLRLDKPYLREFTDEEIKDILYNSELYYLVDRDVINIYLDNNEVFDTIVNDILKGM